MMKFIKKLFLNLSKNLSNDKSLSHKELVTEVTLRKLQEIPNRAITHGEVITEITAGANLVDGKQTWEHADTGKHDIDRMKRCCEAELKMMELTESVPAPYYFWRVAVLSRKNKDYQQEIDYCEKYINVVENYYKKHGCADRYDVRQGPRYAAIKKRLPKAKNLLDKSKRKS